MPRNVVSGTLVGRGVAGGPLALLATRTVVGGGCTCAGCRVAVGTNAVVARGVGGRFGSVVGAIIVGAKIGGVRVIAFVLRSGVGGAGTG